MIHRSLIALAIALALGAGLLRDTAAQEASPSPIPASACTVEPIPFERLTDAVASPVASPVVPEAVATPSAELEGEPADETTTAAIRGQVEILVACINAGDLLRSLTLYSDRFIGEVLGGQALTQAQYDQQLALIEPRPAGVEVVIIEFGEVVILPDGRAAVRIVGDDLQQEDPASSTDFYFVEEAGEWRIDATYDADTGDETTG